MADGVPSVLVIVDGDQKYPTVIGPSVIMKYLVVNKAAEQCCLLYDQFV